LVGFSTAAWAGENAVDADGQRKNGEGGTEDQSDLAAG
jgi:hypothetical protein